MAKNLNRKVTIYINGREVENTLQSIRNEVVKLEREQRKLPIGSEEYLKKGKEIAELKTILRQQKVNVEDLGSAWKDATFKMAEYSNIIMGIQSAFQMLDLGIGKIKDLAKDAAALDDAYGQVQKTTGLTHEEVEKLNELFKKMDTRTSREQLNQLAYEAGKLGIQGVKDVAALVDASDKINVALGDVLGEGAMVTIGKMAGVYAGSTKELADATGDLNKQMLAIGSAVNELGKLSTANEHYLVDFAGRMGGIAVQAGLSADQILGFASALDQDMQKVEMSATAFQKFIGQIMKKPEEFAKQAGMAVSDFSQLVRTDLNEALFRVLQGFSGKGGYAELVNIFKDLGLDGARAASVISAMSNSIDKIKVAQTAANEQLKSGVSIMDEYNTMNNTMQAQAEKAKKRFQEVRIELGNELYPVLIHLQKSGTVLMKGVAGVVQLFKQAPVLIAPVLAAIIAWNRYRLVSIVTSGKLTTALKKLIGVGKLEAVTAAFQERSEKKLIATKEAARLKSLQSILATEKETLARQSASKQTVVQELATKTKNRVYALEVQVTEQAARAEQAHAAATKASRAAFMSMPWGMIITALTTIVALVAKAYKNSENFKVGKAIKEANRLAGEAQGHLLVLKERLSAAKVGTTEYKKALEELRNEYPEIIAKHVDEEGKLRDLEKAYKDLSEAALQNARDRIFAEKTETAYGELAEKEADVAAKIMKSITWKKSTSDEVKDEVERILSEQLRLITSGKKNIEDVLKDFSASIQKYGATISDEMYAEYSFSDKTIVQEQLQKLQKAYEKTESLVNRYRNTLKPIKDEEEEVTYSSLESARKRKEALEAEISVLKKRMEILSKRIENGYEGQKTYERMKSQLYDLEASARGAANEIAEIEKALSGMSVEQMKARKAAVKQEILSLQAKLHVMQSVAYIDFMTKKQMEDDQAKIEQLNREWLQLEQAIKKAEDAARKAGDGNGNSTSGESPAQKKARLAQEAWERFESTYNRLMEKMDAKTLTGASKVVADVDNELQKMYDDLQAVLKKHPEAQKMIDDLQAKAVEWKKEQLDAYIKKMTDELAKQQNKLKDTDANGNEYINKMKEAQRKLVEAFTSYDNAIAQAQADVSALEALQEKASDEEKKNLEGQINALKDLIQQYGILKGQMQARVFDAISTGDVRAKRLSGDESQWRQGVQDEVDTKKQSGLGMLYDKSAFDAYGKALEDIWQKYDKQKKSIGEAREANSKMLDELREKAEADPENEELREKIRLREQELQRLEGEEEALDGLRDSALAAAEEDAFGKAIDKWIAGIEKFGDMAMQLWGNINKILDNVAQKELNEAKKQKEENEELLDEQLENGLISQEEYDEQKKTLQDEYDALEKEKQLEIWKRQKALNIGEATMQGALAVLQALASAPPPYNAILAAISAGLAAVQIAAIASEPEPYAKGGFVPRRTVYQAGEAGPEWVASNTLLSDPATAPIIEKLEDYQRGNRRALSDIPMAALDMPAATAAAEQIGRNRVVVQPPSAAAVWEHPTAAAVGTDSRELVNLMRELVTYEKDPRNRQAVISRRTMDDFNNNENFLRNRARL